ncbi:MAG: protoporphyrinogen oxidase HemJ [Rickettsiales bacterium]|nr:protoporphyrinogen oxidase HemJ [Rickettsiales bacterium]
MDANLYLTLKALHIISFTAWMAGLFYLPRLYVYHAEAKVGSELSETLKVMENKLLRYIMNPAMILTFGLGIWLVVITGYGGPGTGAWIHAKLALVLGLAGFHGACSVWRKKFAADTNTKSHKFFRLANEVPTVLLILIVFLAVLKPF